MEFTIDTEKPVLVTGATGYLAGWIVKRLVEAGVTVHAVVRDPDNEDKIVHLQKMGQDGPGAVKFFKGDLLDEGSYYEAMKGCSIVFHTASPFTFKITDPQRDLVDPAVKGTKNVLASANQAESVKRVVLTSSCAAIYGDNVDCAKSSNGILTENDWNTSSSVDYQPYSYSKTAAERAAWEMADNQDKWKLVVVNPALIIGPTTSGKSTSATHDLIGQFGDGSLKAGAPPLEMGMVDVRDVAEAHVRAAYIDQAEGRHIIFAEATSFFDIAKMLHSKFGDSFPFPKKQLPKWLVWLVGPLADKTLSRKMIANNMDHKWKADNSKGKSALGMTYRPLNLAVEETFQQMIDTGVFKK